MLEFVYFGKITISPTWFLLNCHVYILFHITSNWTFSEISGDWTHDLLHTRPEVYLYTTEAMLVMQWGQCCQFCNYVLNIWVTSQSASCQYMRCWCYDTCKLSSKVSLLLIAHIISLNTLLKKGLGFELMTSGIQGQNWTIAPLPSLCYFMD